MKKLKFDYKNPNAGFFTEDDLKPFQSQLDAFQEYWLSLPEDVRIEFDRHMRELTKDYNKNYIT